MKIIDSLRAMWRKDVEWEYYRECEAKCKALLDDELARIGKLQIRGAADEFARRKMVDDAHYQYRVTLLLKRHNLGLM